MSLGVVTTAHDFRRACQEARRDGELALVPTMGYLHEGHVSLIRAAAQSAPTVAVTIFVNPTQFGPDRRPLPVPARHGRRPAQVRGGGRDAGVRAARSGGDLPARVPDVRGARDALAAPMEGEKRPGHFRGVCTVVAKLFALSRADCAFFGEKDFQQLAVIRRMTADLNLGVEVIGRPIVRESDGLALSSRNAYLSREERGQATALWKALGAARAAFAGGEVRPERLQDLARSTIAGAGLRLDYAELRDPVELQRPGKADPTSRLFLAAFLGKTRLIDNGALGEQG